MATISLHLPDDLKTKAMRLARKKNVSFNALVNHWLQTAILQEETIEWMKRRMGRKNPEHLITEFGRFLDKTKPGSEPTLDEIEQTIQDERRGK